jgi:RNA polymerase sigma-54 factor
VLYHVQRIEPGGIGCCSQRCALLIQLELHGHGKDDIEYRLVEQCWEPLLHLQLAKAARLLGTDIEAVKAATGRLVGLEPRPGRRFTRKPAEYVAPDFSVFQRDGKICGDYNDDRIPRLRLARRFVEILRNPRAFPREQVEFARQKYQRAVMLLKAIESRRLTLERLIRVVVRDQADFFQHGPEHLRPATLKDAARELGVHPSTVSRASANKYVETDFGIFPLKHFFKAGAGDKSRASIKELIRQVIDGEDAAAPLSDDLIGGRLKAQGISISRRTVAKYRGELGIPGRNQRGKL